ncbi:hypothetical protein CYY_008205 [Polysphondylium violaceum]|uniref:Uncharacterized protein n=1 Tax=Polysphondylium violaceum TaxID=133409 RepID=A0A8J4PM13_9MYCE|nr:hypothetical protein CYY_008205 [Polysphondylium violaceum]
MRKVTFILLIYVALFVTLSIFTVAGKDNNSNILSGKDKDHPVKNSSDSDSDSDDDDHHKYCPDLDSDNEFDDVKYKHCTESDSDSDSDSDNDRDKKNSNNNNSNNNKKQQKEQSKRLSFIEWSHTNNKTYSSHEFKCRFKKFKSNIKFIERYNRCNPNSTMELSLTRFADLSHKEFKHIYLSNLNISDIPQVIITNQTATPPPSSKLKTSLTENAKWVRPMNIDWRVWGFVSSVKDQGGCGSCYAFSAVGALESQYFRINQRMLDFSEQELVDCSSIYGNSGCRGGWMHNCFRYIQNYGISLESSYPYEDKVSQCRAFGNKKEVKIQIYVMIPQHDENALADAVATDGPVSVAYDASAREFMYYTKGIFFSESCNQKIVTHAVVAVGYGTENGVDYWILKNSWGANWGEQGYFRMKRNTEDKCGIAIAASYPLL